MKKKPVNKAAPPVDYHFTLPKRISAWTCEAQDQVNPSITYFLDEAIGTDDNGKCIPFPVPHSKNKNNTDVPFLEPDNTATPDKLLEFNRWILGNELPPNAQDKLTEPVLSTVIRDLAILARKYNASLYRLRNYHYDADHHSDPQPPSNPDDPNPSYLQAERNWLDNVANINSYIESPPQQVKLYNNTLITYKVTRLIVDAIKVNNYIVSMRTIIHTNPPLFKELNGSSSHTSLTSPFSSSSP